MDIAGARSKTTPRRKRGGRPVVAAESALAARISAACTVADREQVRAAAAACGITTSEFVLRATLGVRVQTRAVLPEWRIVWTDLAPLASSLHQLVRHLNLKASVAEPHDADTLPDLQRLVPELAAQLSLLRQTLVPPR